MYSCLFSLFRSVFITKGEGMWNIARHVAQNHPPFCNLPSKALRLIYKALVLAGAGVADDHRVEFWALVSNTAFILIEGKVLC